MVVVVLLLVLLLVLVLLLLLLADLNLDHELIFPSSLPVKAKVSFQYTERTIDL